MGAKQSKRSVDISGKEAESAGEVAAAGAGGEGRMEQLADADALKPQANGDAHIHDIPEKEAQIDSGTPENEKDATTEKEIKDQEENEKETIVANGESETKENGDSTPSPDDGKKNKKEKVKKKWSLRSISFSRKDKPKQEKKQKEEDVKTNGEPEKVPEEAAESTPEILDKEVSAETKVDTENKDEKAPETSVAEPLTNGCSTPETPNVESPTAVESINKEASDIRPEPKVEVVEPEELPVNGLSLEQPKKDEPEVPVIDSNKTEATKVENTESVATPESPVKKEVCVDQTPLIEPTPPPLPANPPPSSVASFAATTMAPELTDASRATNADCNESAPADAAPAETNPVDATPAETNSVGATPVETNPVGATPVETNPVDVTPAETNPAAATQAETNPVDATPAETNPVDATPAETNSVDATPAATNPASATPAEINRVDATPAATNPASATPAEINPVVIESNNTVPNPTDTTICDSESIKSPGPLTDLTQKADATLPEQCATNEVTLECLPSQNDHDVSPKTVEICVSDVQTKPAPVENETPIEPELTEETAPLQSADTAETSSVDDHTLATPEDLSKEMSNSEISKMEQDSGICELKETDASIISQNGLNHSSVEAIQSECLKDKEIVENAEVMLNGDALTNGEHSLDEPEDELPAEPVAESLSFPPPGDLCPEPEISTSPPQFQESLPIADKMSELIPEIPTIPELNTETETTTDVAVAN